MLGGAHDRDYINLSKIVYRWDVKVDRLHRVTDLPFALLDFGGCWSRDGHVYCLGGYKGEFISNELTFKYLVKEDRW